MSQNVATFSNIFKNVSFHYIAYFLVTFGEKIGLLAIPTSGHTVS